VVLDRLRAQEQLRRGLTGRAPLREHRRDAQLLRRDRLQGAGGAAAQRFPGRLQLQAGEFRPGRGAEIAEGFERAA
jgi:hypothetical protein